MTMGTVNAEQMMKVLFAINRRFQDEMVAIVDDFSLKYCGKTFTEGGAALAYIFQTNNVSNKLLPNLNKTKKHLYYSNVSTNTFHKTFDISLYMDISLLHDILTKISWFPTCVNKLVNTCPPKLPGKNSCCGKCEHVCTFCKKTTCDDATCPNPSWDYECKHCKTTISYCLDLVCTSCDGKPIPEQCGFHRFMRAINFVKALRNFCSHYTAEICTKFLDEQYEWKEYPTIKNWLNLSEKIVEYYRYLVNFLCNRKAFKQPLALSKRTEKVKSMTKLIENVWLTQDLFVDKFSDTFRKKESNQKRLHLETLCNHEYSISYPDTVHDILKIEIITDKTTLEVISDDKYCFSSMGPSLTIINLKDANLFEENRYFKLRMEYETLEDCNDVIWVATSDCIHADVYISSMISYQDETGKTIHISPDGCLVSKKRMFTEKLPWGILLMLEKKVTEDVLVIQKKKSNNDWQNVEVTAMKEVDEYLIFSMTGLVHKQSYDVRVLSSKISSGESKEYLLFEVINEPVLDGRDLKHANVYSEKKFAVFSHSYGRQHSPQSIVNSENYENLQKLKPLELCVKHRGGRYRTFTLAKLEDYLTLYFKKVNIITFPPIYDEHTPKSITKSVITILEESFLYGKKEFCVLIPDFNYFKAMNAMGLDYVQFGLTPGSLESNGIIVFDLDLHLVLSIRICPGNTINDVKASMELMHTDTKALILLFKDSIGKDHLTVYGTIAFPEMSRVDLERALFCEYCKSDLQFIAADDLQDRKHMADWWEKMCNSLKDDGMRMEHDFSTNREWFSKIPSQMMVVMAYERDDLTDDKSSDQVKAIYYPVKKNIRDLRKEEEQKSCIGISDNADDDDDDGFHDYDDGFYDDNDVIYYDDGKDDDGIYDCDDDVQCPYPHIPKGQYSVVFRNKSDIFSKIRLKQ